MYDLGMKIQLRAETRRIYFQGGEEELTCTTAYANLYPILWVRLGDAEGKNAQRLISHGKNTILKGSPKYELDVDEAEGKYTLRIKDVQPSDDGTYQCQLHTTTYDFISADVKLQVGWIRRLLLFCTVRRVLYHQISWIKCHK